jgi:hypothetical protein
MESNVDAGVIAMKNKLRKIFFPLALLLLPGLLLFTPVQAGDPDWTIQPGDKNFLVCATEAHEVFPIDNDAFNSGGEVTEFDFDPDKDVDVKQLEKECNDSNEGYDEAELRTEFLQQTRIEGYVFEFHPNPAAPGGWMASPSRDVPVVASGPGFEVVWGSEKDGQYFFNNFGAGPITLDLRLPPDAHPINPNITIMSRSFSEIWTVDLAFYRGNYPPPNVEEISLPPEYPRGKLVPADTIIEVDEETGQIVIMPNVGGVLPLDQSAATITLATLILIVLPTAGIITLRRKRIDS